MFVPGPGSMLLALLVAILTAWLLPLFAMRAFMPALENSSLQVVNYRGRRIPVGLGIVWLIWSAGIALGAALLRTLALPFVTNRFHILGEAMGRAVDGGAQTLAIVPVGLVMGAAFFGMLDDAFGSAEAKGFRGHLAAMAKGRLTTGGLKLLGIGALSVWAASGIVFPLWNGATAWVWLLMVLLAAMVIALAANLVNLTDLRPGRALKAYSLLAVAGAVTVFVTMSGSVLAQAEMAGSSLLTKTLLALALVVVFFGPVFAVWKLDLGERGMLGDAGANAMGALAGYALVYRAPLWLIITWLVILLVLNLASEKFSFSRVIDRVGVLRWIDGLGRIKPTEVSSDVSVGGDGTQAGGLAAEGYDAGRDGGV